MISSVTLFFGQPEHSLLHMDEQPHLNSTVHFFISIISRPFFYKLGFINFLKNTKKLFTQPIIKLLNAFVLNIIHLLKN